MKLVAPSRTLVSSGVSEQSSFGISGANQTHIMRILRDQLYTDRVLAVLREYASNAWDANRSAGRGDEPIDVELPNELQPTLVIRDHGPGLSPDDVVNVYTQYGASTKRDSNDVVGMLGIGSKAAFSYVTSFTVTSRHAGRKRVYNATLDETDAGVMQLLHEEPCDDSTGVEVRVPVRAVDFSKFQQHAEELFKYFEPMPRVSGGCYTIRRPDMNDTPGALKLKSGSIRPLGYGYSAMGILGCIPYKISHQELYTCMPDSRVIAENSIETLRFKIGEVDFSANREELKYTDRTYATLRKSIKALNDEVIEHAHMIWQRDDISQWERQKLLINLRYLCGGHTDTLFKALDIPTQVGKPKAFQTNIRHPTQDLYQTSTDYTFVIQDDNRDWYGFKDVPVSRQIVRPLDGVDAIAARDELNELLKEAQLEGVPVVLLSSFEWERSSLSRRDRPSPADPVDGKLLKQKHLRHEFVYSRKAKVSNRYTEAASDSWQLASFTPGDDDIFVVLQRFRVVGIKDYASVFERDKLLAKLAGVTFPKILGYKSTKKQPVDASSCKGKHYLKWQEQFYKDMLANKLVEKKLNDAAWSAFVISRGVYRTDVLSMIRAFKGAGLSAKHDIMLYLERVCVEAEKQRKQSKRNAADDERKALERFIKTKLLDSFVSDVRRLSEDIMKRYPLFGVEAEEGFYFDGSFSKTNIKHWVEYIQLKDGMI